MFEHTVETDGCRGHGVNNGARGAPGTKGAEGLNGLRGGRGDSGRLVSILSVH